jgi:putative acetyltransferase
MVGGVKNSHREPMMLADTMNEPQIRNECNSDVDAIRSTTEHAFHGMPYARGDEQDVIDRLRCANALTLSLVALMDAKVVGHIAFSPAEAGDVSHSWFALGPVSVLPEWQGQGIGSALIKRGLAQLENLDAAGCILTGNPQFYRRFGFQLAPDNAPQNEPAEFFMIKPLSSKTPPGRFAFHEAFYRDTYP